nr:MAG TPA: hypothetical protein [Caudoviricetes sp.]
MFKFTLTFSCRICAFPQSFISSSYLFARALAIFS